MSVAAPLRPPYRMRDLSVRTGLPRQAIHFYIRQGLVPEGHKTGRNMAYYGEEHVERIKLVRRLQHDRFLPLKAIRAILGSESEGFSPEQSAILLEVKERLARSLGTAAARYVDAAEVLRRSGVPMRDLEEMIALGLVAAVRTSRQTPRRALQIAEDDAWIVESWGDMRALGFTRALGFSPRDMGVYEEALNRVFDAETKMLTERLSKVAPARVATMVERAIPLLNDFLVRYHDRKIRAFFASVPPRGPGASDKGTCP